jgi:hypothetical protein
MENIHEYVLSGAYASESPTGSHYVESLYSDSLVAQYLLPDRVVDITNVIDLTLQLSNVLMSEVLPFHDVVVYVNGPRTFLHALYLAWELFVQEVDDLNDETFRVGNLIIAHWDKVTESYKPEMAHVGTGESDYYDDRY